MGYDYYCTYCAAKENNNTVLFDLQPLLTGDISKQLNIIKLRLTQDEVYTLAQQNVANDQNRHACKLSFQEVMRYVANSHNLNDNAVAELTLEELDHFLNSGITNAQIAQKAEEDIFGDSYDEFEEEEEETEEETKEEELPASIQHLLQKDTAVDNQEFAKGRLQEDFKALQQAFIGSEELAFEISLIEEKDDLGRTVLTGMNLWAQGHILTLPNNRVCSRCGRSIFAHAGTAEHKSVVFIGYQSSGKTSTILSLTHYACNHMDSDVGDSIWTGAATLQNIQEVTLLNPSDRLKEELSRYPQGYAPDKTDRNRREDAYSATFLVKSGRNGTTDKVKILTLTDLPGELCEIGGSLRATDIYEKFSVAMACDAFVVCLDTSTVEKASSDSQEKVFLSQENGKTIQLLPSQVINDTCRWADEFQKLLIQNGCKSRYVPMMLLFTKCRELENPEMVRHDNAVKNLNPIGQVYMFREEQSRIEHNKLYNIACEKFGSMGELSNAYHAMLRCSPYGYDAPSFDSQGQGNLQAPKPSNISQLMQWLLCVFGCIPTMASYKPNPMAQGSFELNNYYITRPQHRQENPRRGQETQEALVRCRLFENPGRYDRDFLKVYGQRARLVMEILLSKANSNAM